MTKPVQYLWVVQFPTQHLLKYNTKKKHIKSKKYYFISLVLWKAEKKYIIGPESSVSLNVHMSVVSVSYPNFYEHQWERNWIIFLTNGSNLDLVVPIKIGASLFCNLYVVQSLPWRFL